MKDLDSAIKIFIVIYIIYIIYEIIKDNEKLDKIEKIISIITNLSSLVGISILSVITYFILYYTPSESNLLDILLTPTPTSPPTVIMPTVPPTTIVMPTVQPTEVLKSGCSSISEKDHMILCHVPAGEFLMGSTKDEPDANKDEFPKHSVYLDDFWIDQTEVTNKMFRAFVNDTGYQTDAERKKQSWAFTGQTWEETPRASWEYPQGLGSSIDEDHPVVQVSWNDAKTYCEWAGRRLLTEAQWEKAARGDNGRKYPWGNDDIADYHLNFCDKNCPYNKKISSIDDQYKFTAPVGTYPVGASPYGVLNMAGNVREWTADWYDSKYYQDINKPYQNPQGPVTGTERVLRGGSWNHIVLGVRTKFRDKYHPITSSDDFGFRCAVSP